jgi:hypothetical protein
MIRPSIEAAWDRWVNFHPFYRFVMLLLLAAGLGLLAVKPAYRVFKSWRVARNLVAAQKAVEDVRMEDARDLSLTVLRAGDSCIEAFRILEKSTASLRDPRHRDIARALMVHPGGSDEDRLNGFRGIAPNSPLGLLGQAWNTLPTECQSDPRFAFVFADRLIQARHLSEAASVLLAVPAAARTPALDRRLIQILIGSAKRDGYDEAQRLIAQSFPSDDSAISEWLDLLESIPAVSLQAQTLEPVRRILEAPASSASARKSLMLSRIDYAANFSNCAALLDAVVTRWQDQDPLALARFLDDLGLYQRLLQTFPAARVIDHPELFPHVLQAMERSGEWEQALLLLDAHGALLPKYEELAHRAIAMAKTGDAKAGAQTWKAAMGEAKATASAPAYLTLQRLAMAAGMQDEADLAMVEAIRLGNGPLPLYAELKPLLSSLAQQGRENALLEICAIYLSFESGNPVLLTQFAYFACLNNVIEAKTILKAMEALAKGLPNELPIQMTLATAYLCDGQQAKAAEMLDRLELDPAKLSPANRAVFLVTQVMNHRIAKDDPSITEFPWKSLLFSERKKFNELLRLPAP